MTMGATTMLHRLRDRPGRRARATSVGPRRLARLVPLLALLACGDDDEGGRACTMEFRVATVLVVDEASAPVTDATVRTYLERTGELVPVTSLMDLASGHYAILDDNAVGLVRSSSEGFRVAVDRGAGNPVEARYAFAVPGGCHIEKVSGPDTLTVP